MLYANSIHEKSGQEKVTGFLTTHCAPDMSLDGRISTR